MSQSSVVKICAWTALGLSPIFPFLLDGWGVKNKWGPLVLLTLAVCAFGIWSVINKEKAQTPKRELNRLMRLLLKSSDKYEFIEAHTGRLVIIERIPRLYVIFAPRHRIGLVAKEHIYDRHSEQWHIISDVTGYVFAGGANTRVNKFLYLFKHDSTRRIISETSSFPEKFSFKNITREAEQHISSDDEIRSLNQILKNHLNELS